MTTNSQIWQRGISLSQILLCKQPVSKTIEWYWEYTGWTKCFTWLRHIRPFLLRVDPKWRCQREREAYWAAASAFLRACANGFVISLATFCRTVMGIWKLPNKLSSDRKWWKSCLENVVDNPGEHGAGPVRSETAIVRGRHRIGRGRICACADAAYFDSWRRLRL